jgi:hypothetical protein
VYRTYTNEVTKSISTECTLKESEHLMLSEAGLTSPAAFLLPGRPMSSLQQRDTRQLDVHTRIAALKGSQESFDRSGIPRSSRAGPGVH